jgi:hypothetical protein
MPTTCPICTAEFDAETDRRTCSPSCASALGNRGRNSSNCLHCCMVADYYWARDADIRSIEVAGADERHPINFFDYLTEHRSYAQELEYAA